MNETDAHARILHEATRLFGQKGFGATSVREVVDAAGVTKPTMYYWFENKEQLFLEAVRVQVHKLRAIVAGTLAQDGALAERLGAFIAAYLHEAMADEDGCRLMMTATHPVDDGQPEVDLLSVNKENLEAVVDALQAAQAAGEVRADLDLWIAACGLVGAANLCIVAGLHGMPLAPDTPERILKNFLFGVLT